MSKAKATFSADWLSLREPFDTRARSRDLARRFVRMLPEEPRILDLGAGAGSQFRWLAPIIGGSQHWLLADNDDTLLERGLQRTAAWARRLGYNVSDGDTWFGLRMQTPRGVWRIDAIDIDLSEPPTTLPLAGVDGVTCNAWLDLVSEDWLDEFLHAIGGLPCYASITVDGRDRIRPRRRDDVMVWLAYVAHQIGDKGFQGNSLGPDLLQAMRALCGEIGLQCITERADWHVRPNQTAMLRALLDFWANAAREILPRHAGRIDAWMRHRRHQADAARLAMRIGHRDILILPSGGPRNAAGRDRRRLHRGD